MRLGGARSANKWGVTARRVVAAAAIVAGVTAAGSGSSAQAAEATKGLWAVTRDGGGHMHVVRGMAAAVASMDNRLGRVSAQVVSSEQDETVKVLSTNDALRPQQWAFDAVDFESAWKLSTGAGVTVAVVDTGVLGTHEDLAGSVLPGLDLAADASTYDHAGNGEVDPAGHGTHVAGIIAAHANNGVGIAGAAPGARILPVRVLDASGSGSSSDVAEGIIWAADHGARVINLSLGGGPSPGMQIAIQYALSKQVVTFAAAGNAYQDGNQPTYPAAYPEAVAVAAIDQSLNHASFSNTGSYVDIAAPGDLIWSTYGTGRSQYALMSGTSMATPYATATAALVLAESPNLERGGAHECGRGQRHRPRRTRARQRVRLRVDQSPRGIAGGVTREDQPRHQGPWLLGRDRRRSRAYLRESRGSTATSRARHCRRPSSPPPALPTARVTGSPVRTARSTRSATPRTAAG